MQKSIKAWRKEVALEPMTALQFVTDDKERKAVAKLSINNASNTLLLFKIKTTNPVNYSVNPSQGVVMAH